MVARALSTQNPISRYRFYSIDLTQAASPIGLSVNLNTAQSNASSTVCVDGGCKSLAYTVEVASLLFQGLSNDVHCIEVTVPNGVQYSIQTRAF